MTNRVCKCGREHLVVTAREVRVQTTSYGGYHTPSDYSTVRCTKCGATWRSDARYVDRLPDANPRAEGRGHG